MGIKLDTFINFIQKELPSPPRPGLIFDRSKHRWVRPKESKIDEKVADKKGIFDPAPLISEMKPGWGEESLSEEKWLKLKDDAKNRIPAWKSDKGSWGGPQIPKTDKEIILEGYRWRKTAHKGYPWDWAMWEEIQKLASKHEYKYKDIITKQDVLNEPLLPDVDELLGSESNSDRYITDWRNKAQKRPMWEFIQSKRGKEWRVRSLRELWSHIKKIPEEKVKEFYPGLGGLKKTKSWNDTINTKVLVYRGILGKKEDAYVDEFVSYTTCPKVAEKFSRGYLSSYDAGPDAGIIVKREVLFGDLLGYLNPDGENEVLLPPPTGLKKEEICQ